MGMTVIAMTVAVVAVIVSDVDVFVWTAFQIMMLATANRLTGDLTGNQDEAQYQLVNHWFAVGSGCD